MRSSFRPSDIVTSRARAASAALQYRSAASVLEDGDRLLTPLIRDNIYVGIGVCEAYYIVVKRSRPEFPASALLSSASDAYSSPKDIVYVTREKLNEFYPADRFIP